MRMNWVFKDVPQEVWDDLKYNMAYEGLGDEDCVDNYRAYRVSDDFLKDEYIQASNKGCCGSFQTWTKVNGEKWIMGCNYGH